VKWKTGGKEIKRNVNILPVWLLLLNSFVQRMYWYTCPRKFCLLLSPVVVYAWHSKTLQKQYWNWIRRGGSSHFLKFHLLFSFLKGGLFSCITKEKMMQEGWMTKWEIPQITVLLGFLQKQKPIRKCWLSIKLFLFWQEESWICNPVTIDNHSQITPRPLFECLC
jgi:hypothetical protein